MNFALCFLCIKAPFFFERVSSKKRAIVVVSILNAFTWLPIALIFVLHSSVSFVWLLVLWTLNLVPEALLIPLRDSWLADLIPVKSMGRYLGARSMVTSVSYLAAFYVMGYLLDYSGVDPVMGFGTVFTITFIATSLTSVLYFVIKSPPAATPTQQTKFGFIDFLKETRKGNLGTFIVFLSLFALSVNLSSPLYAVYMLKDLHFTYVTFMLVISSEYFARIISAGYWGRWSDQKGNNLKILGIVSHLIPFIPLLWLVSSNIFYLITIQLMSGAMWAGYDLVSQTFIYKAAPQDKRLRYIVYYKSLNTLAIALGALGGVYLLSVAIPIRGSTILTVFLVSGLLRFAVVKGLFHKLIDLSWPTIPYRPMDWASAIKIATPSPGLFYQPLEWAQYYNKMSTSLVKPQPSFGLLHSAKAWARYLTTSVTTHATSFKKMMKTHSPQGLFYQRKRWSEYASRADEPRVKAISEPVPAGLFYQPRAWQDYVASFQLVPVPVQAGAGQARLALFYEPRLWPECMPQPVTSATLNATTQAVCRQGLFYDLKAWADYASQPLGIPLAMAATSAQSCREGLLHRPQQWAQYLSQSAVGQPLTVVTPVAAQPLCQGLYYQRQAWAQYLQPAPAAMPASQLSRQALFHQPQAWAQYRQSMAPVAPATTPAILQPPIRETKLASPAASPAPQPGVLRRLNDLSREFLTPPLQPELSPVLITV